MSPLFVCERCGTVDNTALAAYWNSPVKLCFACANDGKWHGFFPQEPYDSEKHGPQVGTSLLLQRPPRLP